MPLQTQIGSVLANDGGVVNQRGDNYGNTTMQQFNGKYAELARRGQLFNCQVATAAAYLITNTTGNCPTIWNPAGSGKLVYVLQLYSNWLSGVTVAGSINWALTAAGSNIGTGAPVVTFTNQAPAPALIGSSSVAATRFAPAVCTFTAAPVYYSATGINYKTEAGDYIAQVDYDGSIALMPGNALSLVYTVATSTGLYFTDILIAELPMPVGVI